MTQDEVKVLRHSEGVHSISDTQGEPETPDKHGATASSSPPYSMTPSKPFEDSLSGEVVENFAAGKSAVDETDNCVENDATDKERTSVMESDQKSVVLSDEDQRAKGLVTFEESFLLNKSDQVGNKVENSKEDKSESIRRTRRKTAEIKHTRAKMRKIAGKQKWIVLLICEETSNMDQKEVTFLSTIASRLG